MLFSMKNQREKFEIFVKKLEADPELKKELERFCLILMREQKKLCADSFKLPNLIHESGECYIKVSDAQADIMEARLVIDYPEIKNKEKILSKIFGWLKW